MPLLFDHTVYECNASPVAAFTHKIKINVTNMGG